MIFCALIFFFQQKAAYHVRISDWSSDVCSSDLLSMHTALRSAGHPATMMGNVAFVAQNDSPAPPRRFLPWFHLVARLVLQPVRVMHLERTISVAARFALSSAQACGEVVRTLREARADRDFIDNGVIPCLHDQMLQPPQLMDARLTSDHGGDSLLLPHKQRILDAPKRNRARE